MTKERRGRYYWTRRNSRSVWWGLLVFGGLFAQVLVRHFGMSPLPVFVVLAALIIGWGLWDYRATVTR